jgi:hypothetical protein
MQQESSKNTIRIAVSIISILLLLFSIVFVFFNKEEPQTKPKVEVVAKPKVVPPVVAKVEPEEIKPAPVAVKEEPIVVKDSTPNTVKVEIPIVVKKAPPVVTKEEPPVVAKEAPPVVKEPEPVIVKVETPVVVKEVPPVVAIVEPEEIKPAPVVIKDEPKVEAPPKIEVVKAPEVVVPIKEDVVEVKKVVPPVLSKEYSVKFCFNGITHFQKVRSAIELKNKGINEKIEFKQFLGLINIEDNKSFSVNPKSFNSIEFVNDKNTDYVDVLCNCELHRHHLNLVDEYALVNYCVDSYAHRNELSPKEKFRLLKNTRLVLLGLKNFKYDESLQKWFSEINLEILSSYIEKL